jgi:hypothetical protein
MTIPTRRFVLGLALIPASICAQSPAADLRAGMQLVYASGGRENPAWLVEAVVHDTTLNGMSRCSAVTLRVNPAATAPERRMTCARNDSLFAWDSAGNSHRFVRPIGPRMTTEMQGRTTVSTYETSGLSADTISGLATPVVLTTVTTRDSTRRVLRRLRERYAPGLGTATTGVFEVPDSTQSTGWRTERSFTLVRITR